MKLIIDEGQLKRFRRRAIKRFPLEYIEVLWGTIENDRITVKEFVAIPHTAEKSDALCSVCGNKTGSNALNYDDEVVDKTKEDAAKAGLQFVGTIHSHPERGSDETSPSEQDNNESRRAGEQLIGILAIWETDSKRKRSHVTWWTPQLAVADISFLH